MPFLTLRFSIDTSTSSAAISAELLWSVLRHSDYHLSDMLLALLILIRIPRVLKVKHLVNDRLQLHGLYQTVHVFESVRKSSKVSVQRSMHEMVMHSLCARADKDAAHVDSLAEDEHRKVTYVPSLRQLNEAQVRCGRPKVVE